MPLALKPPPGSAGAAWPAIVVGLFVSFGGVLFGYDTGTIGGILGECSAYDLNIRSLLIL